MNDQKEFKMSDTQLKVILNACKPVPYIAISGVEPSSPQKHANSAWQQLANEMGFVWDTVNPIPGKSQHYFYAKAKGEEQ